MTDWSQDKARQTYNVAYWSEGYFDVDESGHVIAYPSSEHHQAGIDLYALSQEIQDTGMSLPVLVRFTDILHGRVKNLCDAFGQAMQLCDYQGRYTAVYPIKVNQQSSVVNEILHDDRGCVGLEAGSKPELMAVLAKASVGSVIVCNGYKDREYIRLALIGLQLGCRVYIVVEKLSELELIIREAHDLGVRPCLGVRVRLSTLGAGNWQNTGGEKSKFGLSATQVLSMLGRLQANDMKDCLRMLHFHMGSQIPDIEDIQNGMQEAGRYFAELYDLGVRIDTIDVGGGLGVDYEGTQSRSSCSRNYQLQEYANTIVTSINTVCENEQLPQPDIMTESGRALTAHHAVLITNVIDVEKNPGELHAQQPREDDVQVLHLLWDNLQKLDTRNATEVYHRIRSIYKNVQQAYVSGDLSLEQRAQAEQLYFIICRQIREYLKPNNRTHHELIESLNEKLADKYFCNFSLFQSMPDVWAIQQIFPIMPLHRLDTRPDRHVIIQDLTCDSDGRIDAYVDSEGVESSLPLHAIKENEPYVIGMFMVGAYQEILGDMHNLFGDPDSVNVSINAEGSYQLSQQEQGDTVEDVLRYVHFDAQQLLRDYQLKINQANIDSGQRDAYYAELEAGLNGYTYLED